MTLDPQARRWLDEVAALGLPPLTEQTPSEARANMLAMAARLGDVEPVAAVEEHRIPAAEHEIPVRVYRPREDRNRPAVVFFHGGGWVLGSVETHDALCRSLANATSCVVASVDYRLAPEHQYPAAVDDAYRSTLWLAGNAESLGVDATRIAVMGDSAGGNLAAVTSILARDLGEPAIAFQVLIYPITDSDFATPSYLEHAEGYSLTLAAMAWFWDHYVTHPDRRREPFASPLRALDLRGLPPALVVTARYDPLCHEGEAYAKRLEEAAVSVTLRRFEGMMHGFFRLAHRLDKAREAFDLVATTLRQTFQIDRA